MSTKLFRESALERLSSPEQLDQVLPTTSTRGWVSLLAILALLGAVGVWSVFGTLPVQEPGYGMIVSGAGLKQIVANGTGRLRQVKSYPGSIVKQGELVAVIDKKDLEDQLNEVKSKHSLVLEQNSKLDEFDAKEKKTQEKLATSEREILENVIKFRNQRVLDVRARKRQAEASTVATQVELQEMDEEINRHGLTAEEAKMQLSQLDAKTAAAEDQRHRARLNREFKAQELKGEIELLDKRRISEGQVTSDIEGKVIEIRASEGSVVTKGDAILLVEPTGPADRMLEVKLYVSASGKEVTLGRRVLLVPSTVKREEFGSLVGKVTWVADGPTSREAMMRTLADSNLVQEFTRKLGVPKEIKVELTRDENTVTRYEWTSSGGPPTPLSTNTMCNGWITIEDQRPIDLVLPLLKSKPKS